MNRATIGTRIDLNMVRFQEPSPAERTGYRAPSNVNIPRAKKDRHHPPSTGQQVKAQRRADAMAANNRRTEMNRLERLRKLFANKREICGKDAMLILDLKDHRRGSEALQRFAKDGYIKVSRKEAQTNYYIRIKK